MHLLWSIGVVGMACWKGEPGNWGRPVSGEGCSLNDAIRRRCAGVGQPDLQPRLLMDMDFAIDCPLVLPRLPRYPVAVRGVASSLYTSFRRSLAVPPLCLTRASPPSGCTGDFHSKLLGMPSTQPCAFGAPLRGCGLDRDGLSLSDDGPPPVQTVATLGVSSRFVRLPTVAVAGRSISK
jgi:hypothetical protein